MGNNFIGNWMWRENICCCFSCFDVDAQCAIHRCRREWRKRFLFIIFTSAKNIYRRNGNLSFARLLAKFFPVKMSVLIDAINRQRNSNQDRTIEWEWQAQKKRDKPNWSTDCQFTRSQAVQCNEWSACAAVVTKRHNKRRVTWARNCQFNRSGSP